MAESIRVRFTQRTPFSAGRVFEGGAEAVLTVGEIATLRMAYGDEVVAEIQEAPPLVPPVNGGDDGAAGIPEPPDRGRGRKTKAAD